MADDEYVETSDPEEREELYGQSSPYWNRDWQLPGDDLSRRKRIKLRHRGSLSSSPLRPSSIMNFHTGSPSASSASLVQGTLASSTPRSSSLVQTPVHTHIAYSEDIWIDDTDNLSQDPLLLSTHSSTKHEEPDAMFDVPSSPSPPSYTDDEPAHGRESYFFSQTSSSPSSPSSERPQSLDPLSLSHESSQEPSQSLSVAPSYCSGNLSQSRNQTQDPFESLIRTPTSPLTPPPSSQHNLITLLDSSLPKNTLPTPRTDRTIDQLPDGQNNESNDTVLHNAEVDNIPAISRYTLRRRALAQIKPYTVEKLQYKEALSANPDAIVNYRELGRVTTEHYDHADDHIEDSQALWRPDDVDQCESGGRRGRSRKTSLPCSGSSKAHAGTEELAQYPEILQDLPSTDDEEARDFRKISKEARRLARERVVRENREARGRAKNPPKARPFPLKEVVTSPVTEETRGLRSSSLCSSDDSKFSSPPSPCLDDIHIPVKTSSLVFSPASSPFDELDASHSYSRSPTQFADEINDIEARSHIQDKILSDAQMETLGRMYPAFMLPHLAKDARPRKVRAKRATSVLSDSRGNENDVLLPGQTRIRPSKDPGTFKDVKGDTESSDEERNSVADSDTDIALTRWPSEPNFGRWESDVRSKPVVLELTDSSVEDSDDGVDDEVIKAYLDDGIGSMQTTSGDYGRGGNLIDYMLARTRIVHDHPSSRNRKKLSGGAPRKRDAKSSKPRKFVTRKGGQQVRRERQTRLNFDRHHMGRKGSSCKGGSRHSPSFRRAPSDVEDREPYDDHDCVAPVPEFDDAAKKKSRKEMERERRARAKGNGFYTFTSDNAHIVTGRGEPSMRTVNIEDEGFDRRKVPRSRSRDWALPSQPPYPADVVRKKPASEQLPSPNPDPRIDNDAAQTAVHEARPLSLSVDCNIPVLYSGMSFGADTYIGKGWLSELVSITRREIAPPMPAAVVLHGIELGPSTSIEKFAESLGRIFDALFDMITDFGIEAAKEKQEWGTVQRVATQLLSWFLAKAMESDAKVLQQTVREQTSKFVSRIRGLSLKRSLIDRFILSVSWFAVEVSARLGPSFPLPAICAVDQSVPLLVHHLLEYGFEQTMNSIVGERALDGATTPQYAAELWVSLFHLADNQRDASVPSKQIHPFLSAVKQALESRHISSASVLEASETIWRSIFSLCALTQFSVHGMTTGKSRLPPCWDLVVHALKSFSLVADHSIDDTLPLSNPKHRDKYIALVTHRCFHLWSVWNWHFDNPSDLFSQLSDIFRSRKFAGLCHEPAEYPSFFAHHDWGRLSKHDRRDTTFVVFLKLLVQAAGCDEADPNRTLSPRAKKLLSLAIPVGSLPFSKKTPLIVQDLTMLYNRFSALAVAIYLDPTHHASRISHARMYDDFADANETTRVAVIRGMMYFAIMLKTAKLSMEGIKGWIESMATVLVNDFKGLQTSEDALMSHEERVIKRDRVSFCVHLLIGSVRKIVKAYESNSDYPEPMLLSSLEPVFRSPQTFIDLPRMAEEIRQLVQIFLDARKLALPPPRRPRIVFQAAQESQESQDEYYTVDMDYDDPALLAMLDGGVGTVASADLKEKEAAVKSSINGRFLWWAWRNLNKWVPEPAAPVKDDFARINRWLDCWLGCADILIRADRKTWSQYLDLRKSWKISDRRKRRVDLSVMMRVLKLDPMTYVEYQDNYIETLMVALASTDPAFECEFISLLLSIDGCQHPLLAGLSTHTTNEITDEYPREREPKDMIRIILCNLASQVQQKAMGDGSAGLDCEQYVGFCIKMLQAMQDNLSNLETESEARQKYLDWCRSIVKIIHEHRELRMHPRLTFWIAWGRELC